MDAAFKAAGELKSKYNCAMHAALIEACAHVKNKTYDKAEEVLKAHADEPKIQLVLAHVLLVGGRNTLLFFVEKESMQAKHKKRSMHCAGR